MVRFFFPRFQKDTVSMCASNCFLKGVISTNMELPPTGVQVGRATTPRLVGTPRVPTPTKPAYRAVAAPGTEELWHQEMVETVGLVVGFVVIFDTHLVETLFLFSFKYGYGFMMIYMNLLFCFFWRWMVHLVWNRGLLNIVSVVRAQSRPFKIVSWCFVSGSHIEVCTKVPP